MLKPGWRFANQGQWTAGIGRNIVAVSGAPSSQNHPVNFSDQKDSRDGEHGAPWDGQEKGDQCDN
jgi:hypothetical protein